MYSSVSVGLDMYAIAATGTRADECTPHIRHLCMNGLVWQPALAVVLAHQEQHHAFVLKLRRMLQAQAVRCRTRS